MAIDDWLKNERGGRLGGLAPRIGALVRRSVLGLLAVVAIALLLGLSWYWSIATTASRPKIGRAHV